MELVVLKQLPILEEQIKSLSAEIQKDIDHALSLECTAENKAEVKKVRTGLSKKFADFEQRRKDVKTAINKPYDDFNDLYKIHIGDKFKGADADLKRKVDEIENAEKQEKENEVKAYFDEYLAGAGIDFVTFQDARINVTLSASVKSLKEQAKSFVDRVSSDLLLINTQEHKAEILVEYKKSLNVSQAITTVSERHKAIEREKERVEEIKQPTPEVKISLKTGSIDDFLSSIADKPKRKIKVVVSIGENELQALKGVLVGYDYEVQI